MGSFVFIIVELYTRRSHKVEIAGAPSGILRGKRIAIKDNIAVAGIPLENGSKMWQGYTPEYDATVVTRILDAGEKATHSLSSLVTWSAGLQGALQEAESFTVLCD